MLCAICLAATGCQPDTSQVARHADAEQSTARAKTEDRSGARQQPNIVAANDTATEVTPAPIEAPTNTSFASHLKTDSTPDDVCRVFLAALRIGDRVTAWQLLTRSAQLETSRANLELESPGSPNARIEVLPTRFATANRQMAQVDCLLREPGIEGPPIRLAWLMRKESNGWKISGMSIETDEEGTVELLSFESPEDLQRIQETIEAETPVDTATHTASDQLISR